MPHADIERILAAESTSIDAGQIRQETLCSSVRRVAIFTEAFLPKVDGVSRTALLTIRYLQASGRNLIVFAPHPAPAAIDGTPIHALPSLWLPDYPETRVAPPWPFLLRRLRRFRPDLIHLFSPFSLGAAGMMAGGALGVPVIANYQTDLPAYTRTYRAGWLRGTFIGILRFIHNGCHLTLAPSAATLDELRGWRFHRLRLWGRGVDAARFTPARRQAAWRERLLAGRDPARIVVLYVGRMAKEKHLHALRDLAADQRVALTLIGGGNHEPTIRRLLTSGGREAHFIGHLIGDDLADAYAAADVFVFPGPEETFGQVVLEAMASGLPVIVTSRGGPATLVTDGENGFICPVDDAAAFRARVLWLLDNPAARALMGAAARQYAESRSWMQIMGELERHYADAIRLHARLRRFQRLQPPRGRIRS